MKPPPPTTISDPEDMARATPAAKMTLRGERRGSGNVELMECVHDWSRVPVPVVATLLLELLCTVAVLVTALGLSLNFDAVMIEDERLQASFESLAETTELIEIVRIGVALDAVELMECGVTMVDAVPLPVRLVVVEPTVVLPCIDADDEGVQLELRTEALGRETEPLRGLPLTLKVPESIVDEFECVRGGRRRRLLVMEMGAE